MNRITALVEELRTRHGTERVPGFDSRDGGSGARILLLLETPGPKAVITGVVSRDNPDPTAAQLLRLGVEAGIRREDTVLWNVVPWKLGDLARSVNPTSAEVREALPVLEVLLSQLGNLEAAVLFG